MARLFFVLLLCGLAAAAGRVQHYWPWREVRYGPGIVAPEEPLQEIVPEHSLGQIAGADLTGLAKYAITARVLSTRRYRYDQGSGIAPIDIAVGWGPMSDEAVLDRLDLSQSFRFYFYQWRGTPPLPPDQIVCHSANMHIIPASPEVEHAAFGLPRGAVASFRGELVRLHMPDGGTWNSSLSRTDTGSGACELFYVQSLELRGKPPAVTPAQGISPASMLP